MPGRTTDAVLEDLAKGSADHARPAEAADAVAGVPSRYVVSPASTSEVAEVLRVAAQHELAVVCRGGATKLAWGGTPAAADLVLDTTGLAAVVDHAAGDLVVVTGAGTTVAELQAVLGRAGQELVFDNPLPGATVGGSLATAPSGPRRLLRGTLRDLLIGVTFVRADGVVAKAGGRVVKNVAGYDFGKLLTGSYGTLGVITEAVFRLHPVPAARALVTTRADAPPAVADAARSVLASQTVPSAVEMDQPADGPATVAVLLEGTDEGVTERAGTVQRLLGEASRIGEPPSWWSRYPFAADDVGLKLTCAVSGLAPLLTAVRDTALRHGVPLPVRGSAAGVLHAGLPAGTPVEVTRAVVADLREAATAYGGTAVVLTAPAGVRDDLDLWGPVPGLTLMRRLKDELDPGHRLAPGRFVGGI